MKICFLIHSLGQGGSQRVVLTLSDTLIKQGHTVDIVSIYNIIDYSLPNNNINVYIFNKNKKIIKIYTPIVLLNSLIALNNFLSHKHYDIIISHSSYTSIIGRFIRNCRIYHCIHSPVLISKLFNNILSRWIYNDQDIIAVSNGLKKIIISYGVRPKSIQTIYNPLNIETIRSQAEEFKVKEDNYIIAVGDLIHRKRYDLLIQAYKHSNIKKTLIILGKGKLHSSLIKLIRKNGLRDRIQLKGFVQNPYPYIKKADALVMSSELESFGLVLTEALLLGTPVVSTNCPVGPNEILTDQLSHFLSPNGNVQSLALNIQKVIKNPPTITEKFYTHLDANYIAKEYLEYCSQNSE